MSGHGATLVRVKGEGGERVVVEQAGNTIWIANELWRAALDPDRERITGDMEIHGDEVSFGTPGEGLGRLTYRVANRTAVSVVCQRIGPIKCADVGYLAGR